MKCAACSRTNLPGGVRCVYCGTPFPPSLDFEIHAPAPSQSQAFERALSGREAPTGNNRKRGVVGALAVLALKAKSLLVLLKFGKIALTLGSMFVYVAVYSRIFGWPFATGIAVCIFIHEMGHVTVNWMKGLKATAPMFIPFVGALIFIKQFPNDPKIQSESGAGGPAAGLLAALGCYTIGLITGSPYWFALSGLGAFINLFNMVPFPPLDGSHIVTVFSPRIYTVVLITLLLTTIKLGFTGSMGHYSVMILFILFVGFVFRLGKAVDTRHLLAAPPVRLRMAFIFVGLCVSLTLVGAASDSSLSLARSRMHANVSDIKMLNEYAVPAEDQPLQTSEAEYRVSVALGAVACAIALSLIIGLWCLCAYMISRSAGKSTSLASVPIVVAMYCFCLNVLLVSSHALIGRYYELQGAMLVATCAATIYCGYVLAHRSTLAAAGPTLLIGHALAWAAGAGLITAYAMDSLPAAIAVITAAALYSAANRWIVFLLVAQAYCQLGRSTRAIRWFNRSLSANPPADARVGICFQLVDLELRLSHGSEALTTLDAVAALIPDGVRSIQLLSLRSTALMLLDRFGRIASELLRTVPADNRWRPGCFQSSFISAYSTG